MKKCDHFGIKGTCNRPAKYVFHMPYPLERIEYLCGIHIRNAKNYYPNCVQQLKEEESS